MKEKLKNKVKSIFVTIFTPHNQYGILSCPPDRQARRAGALVSGSAKRSNTSPQS